MSIYAEDGLRTRRSGGSVSFIECPKYLLVLSRPVILPKGYPIKPRIIGEHIRKRRLDLGLTQIEAAAKIGVKECSIWNWEHGTEPELQYMPVVIEFLGYVPFECPDDTLERLRYYKRVNGLSYRQLGRVMGTHSEQLMDWLSGRMRPCGRNIQFIADFLNNR